MKLLVADIREVLRDPTMIALHWLHLREGVRSRGAPSAGTTAALLPVGRAPRTLMVLGCSPPQG